MDGLNSARPSCSCGYRRHRERLDDREPLAERGRRRPPATRRISTRSTASGGRSRGRRRRRRSTSWRTGCSRSASARETRSRSSRGRASSGRCSTSRSVSSARSARRSTRRARRATSVRPRALGGGRRARRGRRAAGQGRRRSGAAQVGVRRARRAACSRPRIGRGAIPDELAARADSIDEDDLFTFIYTSGTTGPPKACMIRHRNYYAMVQKSDEIEELLPPGDVMLLYLPLAHNYGRLLHLSAAYHGYTIAFLPDPYARRRRCRRCGRRSPERAAPLREGPRRRACAASTSGPAQRACSTGRSTSAGACRGCAGEEPVPRGWRAAPDRRPARLLEGEGASWAGACASRSRAAPRSHARSPSSSTRSTSSSSRATACPSDDGRARQSARARFKFGTVGPALPGIEVKTADDGEILIRSRPSSPATTTTRRRRARRSTPTAGCTPVTSARSTRMASSHHRPQEGHHRHRRRQERRAPEHRECAQVDRVVSQALVVGDRRPYVVALVTLDGGPKRTVLAEESRASACSAPWTRSTRDRSRFEQIRRFAIVPRDFSAEEGEVTPTMKLKRKVVERAIRRARSSELYAELRALEPAGSEERGRSTSASLRLRSPTTSPVCGAWMNLPPPM